MTTIEVQAQRPYNVHIGHDLLDRIVEHASQYRALGIVYQPTVAPFVHRISTALEDKGTLVHCWVVPDAEEGKTLRVAEYLWEQCGKDGLTRADAIMGVGGGAATDLAGFIASTWMRGIDFLSCPTSLLGMVDAGVGGKTGINNAIGKNLVGTFHEPCAVFADISLLHSLPEIDLVSGLAEIIKCGFIADTAILDIVSREGRALLDTEHPLVEELVQRAIQVKADVVSVDLREAGLRENLNYGHTLGHAIERNENYSWRHGCAVSVGMVFAAALAHTAGLLTEDQVAETRELLSSVGLPVEYPTQQADELIRIMYSDKKNRSGYLRFVVLSEYGQPTRLDNPSTEALYQAFRAIEPEEGSNA